MVPTATRRRFLAALLGTLPLGLTARRGRADDKHSKETVRYQHHPQGAQRCGNCERFIPVEGELAGLCAIVAGEIDPDGWCTQWTQKKAEG